MLTLNEVKDALPAGMKGVINQTMVDQLNALSKDPEEARFIRDNFVTYNQVLSEGRYKLSDYTRAIMYCTHKILGKPNLDAYKATFPERYQRLVAENKPTKDIAAYVSAYNKGQLVSKILAQAAVPTWLLNQHHFQDAINVQADLMNDTTISPKVRSDAANSLLTHLKQPETNKAELKVEVGMNDGLAALEARLAEMANAQMKVIDGHAMTVEEIAAAPLNLPEPVQEEVTNG